MGASQQSNESVVHHILLTRERLRSMSELVQQNLSRAQDKQKMVQSDYTCLRASSKRPGTCVVANVYKQTACIMAWTLSGAAEGWQDELHG